jgi:FKBP-type peptidyl-prolyl cis-trans isomerase 2
MIGSGNTVEVHYTGRLTNGDEFDSSNGRSPLKFTVGQSQVIVGFENAVMGKNVGDKITVNIPCDEAYGPVLEQYTQKVPLDSLPKGVKIGDQLQAQTAGGDVQVLVTELTSEHGVVDANHPLAGQDLTFDIEIVSVY